jgi:hypothetical protein
MRPTMKGKGFNDVLEIQQNSQQVLTITKKNSGMLPMTAQPLGSVY